MEEHICPDCKGQVKLELIETVHNKEQEEIGGEEYYRCPVCRTNYDLECLEE